jgi:hypothetical protein
MTVMPVVAVGAGAVVWRWRRPRREWADRRAGLAVAAYFTIPTIAAIRLGRSLVELEPEESARCRR